MMRREERMPLEIEINNEHLDGMMDTWSVWSSGGSNFLRW